MAKRYSISVGINDYIDCKELSFAVKDAEDIADVLERFCNVDNDNVRLITSEKRKPNSDPWATFCDTIEI